MQAHLEIRRSPVTLILILFVIAAALLLGGSLGYVLKPATVVNTPARVVVVHDESSLYAIPDSSSASASPDACVWIGKPLHKAC